VFASRWVDRFDSLTVCVRSNEARMSLNRRTHRRRFYEVTGPGPSQKLYSEGPQHIGTFEIYEEIFFRGNARRKIGVQS